MSSFSYSERGLRRLEQRGHRLHHHAPAFLHWQPARCLRTGSQRVQHLQRGVADGATMPAGLVRAAVEVACAPDPALALFARARPFPPSRTR